MPQTKSRSSKPTTCPSATRTASWPSTTSISTSAAGEVYCLLGANGAGKTTTINLFLNFIPPTTGTCFINGIDVTKDPLEAKKHVAFVSGERHALRQLHRPPEPRLLRQAGRQAEPDQGAVLPGHAPGLAPGEGLRAAGQDVLQGHAPEARASRIAIIKDAPAILLDEPTSGLDPKAAEEFLETLAELKGEGKAILMSTHDIFRAKDIGDRVGIMKEGRLVMERTREELQYEDLVKIYIDYMKSEPLTA